MEKRKRLCYLDLLRIFACFLVVLNHTPGYLASFEGNETKPLMLLIWHLTVEMVVKIGVPIFFMISGSLLLRRDMTYKSLFRRIGRMFGILLGFSIVANIAATGTFYVPGFIRNFASATVDGARPYWYLYAYIGILLVLPFLRSVAVRLTRRDVMYLVLARLVITGILPIMIMLLNIAFSSNMYMTGRFQPALIIVDCMFYPLIGFGVDTLFDVKEFSGKREISFAVMFVGTTLLEALLTRISGGENMFDGLDFLMTISIFVLAKAALFRINPPEKVQRAITVVGSLTFGIYLLDPIIGNFLKPFVHRLYPSVPSYLGVSVLYCLVSMAVCGSLTFLYKKFVKKDI